MTLSLQWFKHLNKIQRKQRQLKTLYIKLKYDNPNIFKSVKIKSLLNLKN